MNKYSLRLAAICFLSTLTTYGAENPKITQARQGMAQLESLIAQAEGKKIDTLKERTALRTAEIYLDYAAWDDAHEAENTAHFAKVARYKKEAEHYAQLLPNFERDEIIAMMQSSCTSLQAVLKGEQMRRSSPEVDWSKLSIKGAQIIYQGKPVFLADWTWKPTSKPYTQYFGQMSNAFISPNMMDESMSLRPQAAKKLANEASEGAGMVFLSHAAMADWALKQEPSLSVGTGKPFVNYDIAHPLSKQILSKLIAQSVPLLKGKACTQLGYMLCNEPRWVVENGAYSATTLSDNAMTDFKNWLVKRHGSIAQLNKRWGTNYAQFEDLALPKSISAKEIGTPLHYDLICFNNERVTEWFRFLRAEVKKADPKAKTHIKIMPDQWTDNSRNHGIDFEELCRMTEIIGNDASTTAHVGWGPQQWWEERYSFNWRELCMGNDFMRSVQPQQIIFNSEGHLISTNKYRNLYEMPEYIRMNYWLAYMQGMNVIQSWYWSRLEDGSSHGNDPSVGYAGSNNHQPRVVNEVHATCIDINSIASEVAAFQAQRRPIRLFYSSCSAIKKATHMDELFELYEALIFKGLPLGFASEGIIKHRTKGEWDAIIIARTPYVCKSELASLQQYINEGGTVLVDAESLKMDEYGHPHSNKLQAGKGKLITIATWQDVPSSFDKLVTKFKLSPRVQVEEDKQHPTCLWRVIKGDKQGHYLVSLINLGKDDSEIKLHAQGSIAAVRDYLTGERLSTSIKLPQFKCLMLELIVQ